MACLLVRGPLAMPSGSVGMTEHPAAFPSVRHRLHSTQAMAGIGSHDLSRRAGLRPHSYASPRRDGLAGHTATKGQDSLSLCNKKLDHGRVPVHHT